MAKNNKVTNNK